MTPGKRFATDCRGCGGHLSMPLSRVDTQTRGIRCGECRATNWAGLNDVGEGVATGA